MAEKTSWHRYGTKLRHCLPMYPSRERVSSGEDMPVSPAMPPLCGQLFSRLCFLVSCFNLRWLTADAAGGEVVRMRRLMQVDDVLAFCFNAFSYFIMSGWSTSILRQCIRFCVFGCVCFVAASCVINKQIRKVWRLCKDGCATQQRCGPLQNYFRHFLYYCHYSDFFPPTVADRIHTRTRRNEFCRVRQCELDISY